MLANLRFPVFAALLFALAGSAQAGATAVLDELFQDHAVLQRERPIPIWGHAQANEEVTITLNAQEVRARADADGRWRAELPAMPAGGPYELTATTSSGTTQRIGDVLVGDVWLCSGQSNMEMRVSSALNAWGEIQRANHETIRLLTVSRDTSAAPLEQFLRPVQWRVVRPDTIADFSAVCFYYARELQKHVNVPMGLIHASWGGSKIEPWMSAAALREVPGYDSKLEVLDLKQTDSALAVKRWAQVWESWWRERVANEQPWREPNNGAWKAAPAQLSHWEEWGDADLATFNGMVWLRRTVELTAKQARQAATLSIGKVDDVDISWVNGESVGSTAGPDTDRVYPVRKGLLKAGENTILVNALDLWGPGGPFGATPRELKLEDGSSVSLEGSWQYRVVPKSVGEPPRAPWDVTAGLTVIGNAMIAPLGEYRMRGVLWYQGESNADYPDNYEALLAAWMKDWRARFGEDAAFLIVQLANFGPASTQPTESGWAGVRDAQRRAVANDENAGLAVAIDLGDRWDIHPANKQQVGYRLARAARHVIYGEAITPSGPRIVSGRRDGAQVVVAFDEIDGGLVAYSSDRPIGFELCGADAGSCVYATATIEANSVRLDAPNAASATRVRYCWADSPICTLFDGAGLPASPFEVSIE